MGTRQNRRSIADLAIDNSRCTFAGVHVQFLGVAGKDLHPTIRVPRSIDKDPSPIIIRPENFWHCSRTQRILGDFQFGRPRTRFAVVHEPGKGTSSTCAREESQLPISHHFHRLVANLKLTSFAAVIATSAETEVCAASPDKLIDASVSRPVQGATVSQVRSARNNQQRTCGCPRLMDEHVVCDGNHGIMECK